MRRSPVIPFLMAAGMALVMFAWRSSSIEAQSRNCLRNCGAGEKPPTCCTPPPCSFWEELKVTKAYANLYSKAARLPAGNFVAEMLKIRGMKTCSDSGPLSPPEPIEVSTDGNCTIGIYAGGKVFTPQSPEDALAKNTSCSELVRAEYAKAEREAAFCRLNLTKKKPLTKAQSARQSRRAYQAKADALEDTIYGSLMACSKVVADKLEEDQKQETDLESRLKALKEAKLKQFMDVGQKFMNAVRKFGFKK